MNKTPLIALALTAVALAGCSFSETERKAGTPGFGDRCADFMERSFPWADITLKNKQEHIARTASSLNVIVATVSGEREKIPEDGGFVVRNVTAECRFENGVLTSFKWTQGPFR